MASDEPFRRPGSIPFKWEVQPGIPKQPANHHGGGATSTTTGTSMTSLLLPPRLALPPAAVAASRVSSSANTLASAPSCRRSSAASAPYSPSSHRRSMSARFATSLVLPFTRPRRGRSEDEADIAYSVLYGDKIL